MKIESISHFFSPAIFRSIACKYMRTLRTVSIRVRFYVDPRQDKTEEAFQFLFPSEIAAVHFDKLHFVVALPLPPLPPPPPTPPPLPPLPPA